MNNLEEYAQNPEIHSDKDEERVLGCLIKDNSLWHLAVKLSEDDFCNVVTRTTFSAIRSLATQSLVYDGMIVENKIAEQGRASLENWTFYLGKLNYDAPMTTESRAKLMPYSVSRILEKSRNRKAQMIGQELAETHDTEKAVASLLGLNNVRDNHTHTMEECYKMAVNAALRAEEGHFDGIKTGFQEYDQKLGGLHNTNLTIIAGAPGMGKTSYALNIAERCGKPFGLISAEQSNDQVGQRMVAIKGRVDLFKQRNGLLDDSEWIRINEVGGRMGEGTGVSFDKPGPTIDEVVAKAQWMRYYHDIELLIVDQIQLIKGPEREKRLEIGGIGRALKQLARELKIPVVALSQIGRQVANRIPTVESIKDPASIDHFQAGIPHMSDLAESAQLEQIADDIILIYRPSVNFPGDERANGLMYVNIAKNRHGPAGKFEQTFTPEYLRVDDRPKAGTVVNFGKKQ